ncbi:MAG: hypothetical protein AABZ53_17910 [Planctomycetota bacterium]
MSTLPARLVRQRPAALLALGGAGFAVAVALGQMVVTAYKSQNPLLGVVLGLPQAIELALVALGLVVVAKALPRRVGGSLHCSECGYQRVEERDRLLAHCPECGHFWRHFGGWRVGKPLGNPRAVVGGFVLCAAALSVFLLRDTVSRWFATQLPTPLLVSHVLNAPPDSAAQSWGALDQRILTSGQLRWIAEGLLERRTRASVLDRRSTNWLHKRMDDGSLDGDLVTRYYEELADFTLDVPPSALAGQTFSAVLKGRYVGSAGDTPLGQLTFVVEGVRVELPGPPADDKRTDFEKQFLTTMASAVPVGQQNKTMDPLRVHVNPTLASGDFSSEFPGVATVHAVVWVLAGPPDGEPVRWGADGVPTTLSLQRKVIRREVTATVQINER